MEKFTLILFVILFFASLYYLVFRKPKPNQKVSSAYPLPPGSSGWPILGETLEYLRTARNGVPEKFINDRRNKYSYSSFASSSLNPNSCKVFKTSLVGEPVAMLCTAAGNKFLFSNENKLFKSWWPSTIDKLFPNTFKQNFSAETIHKRNGLAPFLRPAALQSYVYTIDKITKQHLDAHWSTTSPEVIKVHSLAEKYTFTLSCKIFLNIEDPQVIAKMEKLMRHIAVGVFSMHIDFPGTNFRRAIRAVQQVEKELESIVLQRKQDLMKTDLNLPPQDLMSSLLRDTDFDGEERTVSNIVAILFGPLMGGYDTLIITICSMIMFLSQLPKIYDAVFKEQIEIADSKPANEMLNWKDIQKMKYSWNVICEVLRLQPPASGSFREAKTDFLYEGYLIPNGMKLQWSVFATHKNPEYFPDPDQFTPSRFEGQGPPPYSYVPFGGGPRMCPGKEYARVVILTFMHNLVTRFKWEKVFPDEKMVMNPLAAPTKGLPIRLFPH